MLKFLWNFFKFAARPAVIAAALLLVIAIGSALPGCSDLWSQCTALWSHPSGMLGELIQSLSTLTKIGFVQDIVNVYFSGANAFGNGETQFTLFNDMYFATLSSMIIFAVLAISNFCKNLVGDIQSKVVAVVCNVVCLLAAAYGGTGVALVLQERIATVLFRGNYIVAFLVLIVLQMLLGLFTKKNGFLNTVGALFVDLLLQVGVFTSLLFGNAILFERIYDPVLIVSFFISVGALILAVTYKIEFKLTK